MDVIRRYCCDRIIGIRLLVMLVALYTLIPAHLFSCHEHGATHRIEAASHGILLRDAVSLSGLTELSISPTDAGQAAGLNPEQCAGCTDDLAHEKHETRLTRSQGARLIPVTGGTIFSLQDLDPYLLDQLTGVRIAQSNWLDQRGPLFNRTQILLI